MIFELKKSKKVERKIDGHICFAYNTKYPYKSPYKSVKLTEILFFNSVTHNTSDLFL